MDATKPLRSPGKTPSLGLFIGLSFFITWGIAAMVVLFPESVQAVFGDIGLGNPLVILAVYSPGFVGVGLVLKSYGIKGLTQFLKRLTIWRASIAWWVYLVVGIPAVVYSAAALNGTFWTPLPFETLGSLLAALTLALFLGPVEELGWRGLALPILQRRMAPLWAGLVLGGIWALWHVPAFLISGMPQSTWAILPYFSGVIAISVILTALFNASRGSLLIAVIFHFQMMNPIFPDAQPWDNLLWIIFAVVLVIVKRKTMFSRSGAFTQILADN